MKRPVKRYEVKFAGADGQNITLAADILAEAAISLKYRVTQSGFRELEVRGGLCTSDIIIADSEIDFPKPLEMDILVALSQEGYDASVDDTVRKTVQIIDSLHVGKIGRISELHLHPLTNISHEKTGSEEYANFVALGLTIKLMKFIKDRTVINLIKEILPAEQREKALKAFKEGLKLT
ncbi:MAG TPA: 2-oxoacid:acceptor oxidoreductase family protein [Candidatus Omnitrophota bacterium]|nr:2-oxoacid:acceptor oxidoreductase family protein [Candidatus Omnitrophota bacterium]